MVKSAGSKVQGRENQGSCLTGGTWVGSKGARCVSGNCSLKDYTMNRSRSRETRAMWIRNQRKWIIYTAPHSQLVNTEKYLHNYVRSEKWTDCCCIQKKRAILMATPRILEKSTVGLWSTNTPTRCWTDPSSRCNQGPNLKYSLLTSFGKQCEFLSCYAA